MNIPEEVLDQAAQALSDRNYLTAQWDQAPDDLKDAYREQARAALSAAAPTLMAMALRDAADDWETDVSDPTPRSGAYADGWMRNRADKIKEQL